MDDTTRWPQPLLYPIDNVVFLGMGEPADNALHVMRAVQALIDPFQFQLAPRKITVSTVAPTPQSFEALNAFPVSLAWSVHSSRDEVRKLLVPTTRYSMIELRAGLLQALQQRRDKKQRTILLSITLLHNINDQDEDALHLIDFCQPIFQHVPDVKLVVNLIPWNPFEAAATTTATNNVSSSSTTTTVTTALSPPTWERILAFQKVLIQHGLLCYIRTTRGDDTNAACGQLATGSKTKKNVQATLSATSTTTA